MSSSTLWAPIEATQHGIGTRHRTWHLARRRPLARSERLQVLDEVRLLRSCQIQLKQPIIVFDDGKQIRRTPIVKVRGMLQEPS
jgi:hypothetical protein